MDMFLIIVEIVFVFFEMLFFEYLKKGLKFDEFFFMLVGKLEDIFFIFFR